MRVGLFIEFYFDDAELVALGSLGADVLLRCQFCH